MPLLSWSKEEEPDQFRRRGGNAVDAMLVRERYKVVRVADSREDYAFAEAVDILDREKRSSR